MGFVTQRPRAWALFFTVVLTATAVISATAPGEALRTPAGSAGTTDDQLVNETTAGEQNSAAVARDALGNYVVVWEGPGSDLSGIDIFFRLYDHNGNALSDETVANANTLGTQQNPAVAMSPSGAFAVTWENCPTAGACDVAVRVFANDGTPLGVDITANTTTCGDQSAPAIAMAASGEFVVAWQSLESDADPLTLTCTDDVDGYDIVARQFSAQAVALAAEFAVNATVGFAQKEPAVAMDVDGDFVIAWQSFISGSGQDIMVRPFAADATPGTEFRANNTIAGDQTLPAIAMAADGDFTVVWQGPDAAGNGIFMRRYDSGANQQTGTDQAVNTTTAGEQVAPAVAVDADGDIVVVWHQGTPGDVFYQRFNAAGAAQGTERPANATTASDQAFPAVAADADGDFVIAWAGVGDATTTYGIYLRRFSGPEAVDLSVTKTDDTDPVAWNQPFDYTIVVHNNATAFTGSGDGTIDAAVRAATGVTITDTLPSGVSFDSGSFDGGDNWTCTANGSQLDCTYAAAILPGADADPLTIPVRAPVSGPDGRKVNSATVAGDQYDPTVANSTGTQETWVCNAGSGALQFAGATATQKATFTVGENGDDAGGNGDGKLTVTVSRTGSTCGDATVELSAHSAAITSGTTTKQPAGSATANADYTAVTGQVVTIPNGASSATFDISIVDDAAHESDETFNLQLQNPTRATLDTAAASTSDTARATITNNDSTPTATLSVTGTPLSESGGVATLTATLNAASGQTVTIALNIAAGTSSTARYGTNCVSTNATGQTTTGDNDFNCSASSITIPAGSLTGSVTFTGVGDSRDEEDKEAITYAPTCTNCTPATLTGPVIEIADDDASPTVQFQTATSTVSEDSTDGIPPTNHSNSDTINVTLTGNVTDRTVTVAYAFDPNSPHSQAKATPGTDFTATPGTSGSLTFQPHTPGVNGDTTKAIVLTTVIDQTHENNELAVVTLSGPGNATLGTTATHTTTITDNDAVPTASFVPNTAQVNEGNAGAETQVTATVTLSAVSGTDASIPFGVGTGSPNATNPADHNAAAGTISIPAGQESGTYTFKVFGDVLDEGNEQVVLTMGTPTGASQGANTTHTTTILDDDALPLVFIDTADPGYTTTKSEAGGTVSLVVKLDAVSGRQVTVPYTTGGTATSGSDYTISPATQIVFNAGETSKTVTITLINDTADEPNSETLVFTLQDPNPATGQLASPNCSGNETSCRYTLSITDDDDVPQVSFTSATSAAAEDATTTRNATVQLSRSTSTDITIPITIGSESGRADTPADYTLLCPDGAGGTQACNGEITIAAGTTSGNITISVVGDKNDEADETVTLTLGAGTGYTLQAPTTHTHTITDDDTAGITLVQSSGNTAVNETGATSDTYTVVLTSQPTSGVTVNYSHDGQVTTSPAGSVSFTTADWNTPKTITVTAVDDMVAEGAHTTTIAHTVVSGDGNYSGRAVPDVVVSISDNDSPDIVLTESGGSTTATEGGAGDTYTIVLSTQPTADVTITVTGDLDADASPGTLTFTTVNWNVAQTVTVSAADDDLAEGAHTGTITHSVASANGTYHNRALRSVTVSITDNETAGVLVSKTDTAVTEGGAGDSYTLTLTSQPIDDVTITLAVGADASVNPTTVTFTPVNWNGTQTVTVSAVDDNLAEGAHTDTITHTASSSDTGYNGIAVASVSVAITDNETAGVSLTQSGGSTDVAEGGATDSYTLVLTSQPAADVIITVTDDAEVDASPTPLTFTTANWNVAQTVTVTAVDDAVAEGSHSGTISHSVGSADAAYDGAPVPDVTVSITDNETVGVTVTQSGGTTAVTEGGASDSYTLVLTSQPTADVEISVSSGAQAAAAPAMLTFTPLNWFMAQTVTVTAADDAIAEGAHGDTVTHVAASSDPDYNGVAVASVSVAITDNDTATLVVTESGGSTAVTEAGATDTYTIVLTSEPTADVTVTVTGDADVSGSPGTLTFTSANWNVAQTVTVSAVNDAIAEGAHSGTLTHAASSADPAYNGGAVAAVTASIVDNDASGITVTQSGGSTAVTEGGATDQYTIVLTSQPTASVTVTVTGDADVSGSPGALTFTTSNWNVAQVVTVTAVNDSFAEGAHTGTLTHAASSGDSMYNGIAIASVTANVTDNDSAGVTVTQSGGTTAVAEGGTTDSYTLVLTSQPTANVTVAIGQGGQVTTNPTAATFTAANWNVAQIVTVTAVNDVSAEGTHATTITHAASSADTGYNGIAVASVNVTITDNDVAGIVVTASGGSTAVAEGGATDTLSVQLATQPTSNVTITVQPGTQLTATPATLTFTPANYATAQTVTVGAVDDDQVEGAHTANIGGTASSADPNYNGPLGTISVSITDNDSVVAGDGAPGIVVTPSGNVASTSGEGGGGAFSWAALLGLIGLAGLRRRSLAAALALLPAPLLAQTATPPGPPAAAPAVESTSKLAYTSVDLRYLVVKVDEPSVDASGFALSGSWSMNANMFVTAGYATVETDDLRISGVTGSSQTDTLAVGVGGHYPVSPNADLVGAFTILSASAEGQGGFSGSTDDTGWAFDAGLRGLWAPTVEWGLTLGYVSIFEDTDTSLGLQMQYHTSRNWGILAGVGLGSNATQLNFGARYNF
jgi:hypothetical protein